MHRRTKTNRRLNRWLITIGLASLIFAAGILTGASTADAARKPPDRTSIVSMAQRYHCDILATPGPDWFHGHTVRHWLIGVERKGYFLIDPASVGWEGPVGPQGRGWVKAVCQF